MTQKLVINADGIRTLVDLTQAELDQQVIDDANNSAATQAASAAATKMLNFSGDANYQTLITQMKSATSPAQINTWLTNNVTTLAQAKTVLAMLLFYIVVRDRVN